MGDDAPPAAPQAEDGRGRYYPTYLEHRLEGARPIFSQAYERLIWPFKGSFPSAIQVMPGPRRNIGTPEPLFNYETGEWHEIASHSITDPPVSHLEASLTNLEWWDRMWERKHMDHADPAYDECEFVTYGDLDNDVRPFAQDIDREDGTLSWDEPEDKEILVYCGGEERPLGGWDVALEVRAGPGNEFVTVGDYVSAVHPWLMSLREDIEAAIQLEDNYHGFYPPAEEYLVSNSRAHAPQHQIIHPEDWKLANKGYQSSWL